MALLGVWLVSASSAAAQAPTLLVTTPLVLSEGGEGGGIYFSEPAEAPSIAVTPSGINNIDEVVHVIWGTRSYGAGESDGLWYTMWDHARWITPPLYTGAIGSYPFFHLFEFESSGRILTTPL